MSAYSLSFAGRNCSLTSNRHRRAGPTDWARSRAGLDHNVIIPRSYVLGLMFNDGTAVTENVVILNLVRALAEESQPNSIGAEP